MDDLLNTAPCGFLSFTDDGAIVLMNATLLEMLGYRSDELTGRHVESIFSVAARIFYQTHFFPLLTMHGRVEEIYLELRCKGGEAMPVLVNAVRRERGGIAVSDCVIVVMRQRSQYEDAILRARKSAEEASRARAKFLSMMSHELRTPLQAISGFTEILAMEIHGPVTELQQEDLRSIESASQYLLSLINDILSFTQLEAGHIDIRPEVVPLDAMLVRAETLVAFRLREAEIEYARERCGADLRVRADPDRLQQIVLNLLTNAVKFTPPGGRISVLCERAGAQVLIHVSDSGRGIPADQIDRIFDPFVQVESRQTEASRRGIGLGLAISRELARAMGGNLTVTSTMGQGSVFTVALPAVGAGGAQVPAGDG